MSMGPKLELRQSQSLVMTPQLQQAIKLLQYSTQELNEFIEAELESNPLLERKETDTDIIGQEKDYNDDDYTSADTPDSLDYLNQKAISEAGETPLDADYSNDYDADIAGAGADVNLDKEPMVSTDDPFADPHDYHSPTQNNENEFDYLANSHKPEDLKTHLLAQLGMAVNDHKKRAIGHYLIDHIEDTGWLSISVEEAATALAIKTDEVEEVLKHIQEFDPAGIGARDLKECLALQLKDKNRYDPAIAKLLDHLPLLANREWDRLMRILRVNREDLIDMIKDIRSLDPKPGLAFDHRPLEGAVPDILVSQTPNGQFRLELNPQTLPPLMVNDDLYTRIVGDKNEKEARDYIQEKRQNASWLIKSVRQRADTILRVSEEIVKQQQGFFHFGVSYLRPLVLRNVAEAIDMHESTISRVTTHKYLACSRGIFELKYFFTASLGGADGDRFSAESVRHRIKTLIDGEDIMATLSDDALVDLLKEDGIDIARRTVAKYREEMNIPSSVKRRRLKAQDLI